MNLGLVETFKIGLSYSHARLKSRLPEKTLEDFLINRFGNRLYRTFFKDYTEKVWGVPCTAISADWGAQRIKGLSIGKAVAHSLASPFRSRSDAAQKGTETSLIERFLYPKFGPGQMWEEAARRITALGGTIHLRQRVVAVERTGDRIVGVDVFDEAAGAVRRVACDHFLSTMPVKNLVAMLRPDDARIAQRRRGSSLPKLHDRGFASAKYARPPGSVGQLDLHPGTGCTRRAPADFQQLEPRAGCRSKHRLAGYEYFCDQGDELWTMEDEQFLDFAAGELEKIGLIERKDVIDGTLVRVAGAYPAYFGTYGQFGSLRNYLDRFYNLYPIGRNGMHRYNNQDHSMLTANAAVDSIMGIAPKQDIWNVNTEESYHEDT